MVSVNNNVYVGVLLPKIKKIPKNTNGRLAIPALAGLLVSYLSHRQTGNVLLAILKWIHAPGFASGATLFPDPN